LTVTAGLDQKYYEYSRDNTDDILKKFGSRYEGLTDNEVKSALNKYGYNEPIKRKKHHPIIQFLLKFTNPLIIILLIICVFTLIYSQKFGAIFVFVMVLTSVCIEFFQERRSNKEIEKLIDLVRVKIMVIRNGKRVDTNIKDLVPGDIVELSAGDIVPADCRIINSKDLFVNESSLTGESFPAEKHHEPLIKIENISDLKNIVFMGTSVVSGSATCIVVTTGKYTEFSQIAKNIAQDNLETSFDRGIRDYTWLMVKFVVILVLFIFALNAILKGNVIESLLFALAAAVGLTPEMLPMIVTINLAKGAKEMSKKEVIVKHLESIQNLGAMDILCTDKTGTLTEDRIILEKYCDVTGKENYDVLRYAYINSFYQTGLKNILDEAILKNEPIKIKSIKKVDEIPFDFIRKIMSIVVDIESDKHKGLIIISKGAPEELLKRCTRYELNGKICKLDKHTIKTVEKEYEKLSNEGFRVIAVAYKSLKDKKGYTIKDEHQLVLKGYLAFLDPPKQSSKQTIHELNELGIEVKILTGDNELVTKKICTELNLNIKGYITGKEIDKLNNEELRSTVEKVSVFARVSPLQKERIVEALQKNGHTVGFLGDGINDAPTLKKADVGISVNNAVDIAKESSGIILLNKNLHVLKEGVIDGRKVFSNLIKYIRMGSSSNFGNMFSLAGASLFLPFLPMLPIQLILNNFLYDMSQLAISTDNVDMEEIKKPRPWNIESIKRYMVAIGPISSIFDFITFAIMFLIFKVSATTFQTAWFIESLFTQVLIIHIIRTNKIPFLQSKPSLTLVIVSILTVFVGLLITITPIGKIFGFTPLPWSYIAIIFGILIAYWITTFTIKKKVMKRFDIE